MTENDDYEDTQWTAMARTGFRAAGADLLSAISAHIDFLAAAEIGTPWEEISALSNRLERAALAYASAQFDLTGNSGPFGDLQEWEDEEEDDEDEDDELEAFSSVSVLSRSDYAVLDAQAVLTAGQRMFLANRPGESERNAQSVVSHLGAAFYELAHADGWESLGKAPGLSPLGSIVQVVVPEEAIELGNGPSETGEPDPAFSVSGEVLYTEENRFSF
jgi:hypothetical protein